ncbi:unnamed protein product [Paramecium octaurelia]|uniref:Uncharacterized protein n=1 Tax=Paramecium octaurelia TaxID=43137 RepID=A0A8S1WSY5_PAROT|nr:unnamed protein product [Paramecium octaurelia]
MSSKFGILFITRFSKQSLGGIIDKIEEWTISQLYNYIQCIK